LTESTELIDSSKQKRPFRYLHREWPAIVTLLTFFLSVVSETLQRNIRRDLTLHLACVHDGPCRVLYTALMDSDSAFNCPYASPATSPWQTAKRYAKIAVPSPAATPVASFCFWVSSQISGLQLLADISTCARECQKWKMKCLDDPTQALLLPFSCTSHPPPLSDPESAIWGATLHPLPSPTLLFPSHLPSLPVLSRFLFLLLEVGFWSGERCKLPQRGLGMRWAPAEIEFGAF